uniref:Uncharacterized protein n=1 Tax=Cucumis melo TaxID=3656 RepID=A0A9I9EM72_CUCME
MPNKKSKYLDLQIYFMLHLSHSCKFISNLVVVIVSTAIGGIIFSCLEQPCVTKVYMFYTISLTSKLRPFVAFLQAYGEILRELASLLELRYLHLQQNYFIRRIPPKLGTLQHLRHLLTLLLVILILAHELEIEDAKCNLCPFFELLDDCKSNIVVNRRYPKINSVFFIPYSPFCVFFNLFYVDTQRSYSQAELDEMQVELADFLDNIDEFFELFIWRWVELMGTIKNTTIFWMLTLDLRKHVMFLKLESWKKACIFEEVSIFEGVLEVEDLVESLDLQRSFNL